MNQVSKSMKQIQGTLETSEHNTEGIMVAPLLDDHVIVSPKAFDWEVTDADTKNLNEHTSSSLHQQLRPPASAATPTHARNTSEQRQLSSSFRYSSRPSMWRKSSKLLSGSEFTLNKLNTSELGLYGREKEMQRLQAAVDSLMSSSYTTSRNPALVTIKGYSGIGKSALVQQLKSYVVETKGGLFAMGKFAMEESRLSPYSAFRKSGASLIEHVVNTSDQAALLRVKEGARKLLRENCTLLLQLFPNLDLLLGHEIPSAHDGNEESSGFAYAAEGLKDAARLRFYFQSFVRLVGSADRPLVIVLDDVQWADEPSLGLMDAFLSDPLRSSALLVVTYRDNEVDGDHPMSTLLVELTGKQIPKEEIELRELSAEAINLMVSIVLRMEVSETYTLSLVAHEKTGGNPFFVLQFLQLLIDEEKLLYNYGTLRWYWELDDIQRSMRVTENVAAFLADRISKLGRDRQGVLQVASLLGRSFEDSDLIDIVGSLVRSQVMPLNIEDSEALRLIVLDLIEAGLLDPVGTRLCFVHDQIQAAAGDLIPESMKDIVPYYISKFMIERCHWTECNEHELFLAAGLSAAAIELAKDGEERLSFARTNLRASEDAMRKAAFGIAARYAKLGWQFLAPTPWKTSYELSIALGTAAVEASYCSGDLDGMEYFMEEVLHHGMSIEDKIRVYRTRLESYSAQGRAEECICEGLRMLKELGCRTPSHRRVPLRVMIELFRTKRMMKKHDMKSLTSLPPMNNPTRTWVMILIQRMGTMSFFTNQNLYLSLWLKCIRWSSKHGINEYSIEAFTIWGCLCDTMFRDSTTGIMFVEAALELEDKVKGPVNISGVVYAIHGFLYPWTRDLRASIKPCWYGYTKGMETGNVEDAMYNLGQYYFLQYATASSSLDLLLADFKTHVKVMTDYNQVTLSNFCLCLGQMICKLVGKDGDTNQLSGSMMKVDEILKIARDSKNELLEVWVITCVKELAYLFGNYKLAGRQADLAKKFDMNLHKRYWLIQRQYFLNALIEVAVWREEGGLRRKYLSIARKVVKTMKQWLAAGNVNVVHMVSLIEAELAAVNGNKDLAVVLYKKSITTAARNGFINDTALAHERAADFYFSLHDTYWASHHVMEALRCYEEWAAVAKVEQLRTKHQHIFTANASAHG